jgi:Flp pilus assembly protein TadG
MGKLKRQTKSFLRSVADDRTANTIVIAAAAMIPLLAMVGGGIDSSRYFMAASRLQAACDSGALAARRAMTTDQFTSVHSQIGNNFFDQNFNDGLFGLQNRQRSFTSAKKGVVVGTASGVLPTTIMNAFGYKTINISVTCAADINISNTDIMFVLDVTGSMGGSAGGGLSRIQALRNSVMNFYDTVTTSTSSSARIRFGAVPYMHNVNVGALIPKQYIANSHTYQSRVPNFRNVTTIVGQDGMEVGDPFTYSDKVEWIPRGTNQFGSSNTNHYRFNNRSGRPNEPHYGDRNLCQSTRVGNYNVGGETWQVSGNVYVLNAFSGGNQNRRAGCSARVRKTRPARLSDLVNPTETTEQIFDGYVYRPVTYDVSGVKSGGTIQAPTGVGGAMQTHSWNGCIEEARTVDAGNFNPVPNGAFDLDINLIPSTEDQRWKPSLPSVMYRRLNGSTRWLPDLVTTHQNMSRPNSVCPAAAFRLSEITRPQLQNFVNTLNANGNTYHDIGMIWGARLISPRGIFAADNATAPNGDPISRHIVFMTDGQLVPNLDVYGTYGVEWWDRRITGDANSSRMSQRHAERFQAACRAAKNENISVWVVAFGTTLTQNLVSCASPGRAYSASAATQLEAAFQEIAQKIAALRLTQ